LNINPGFKTRAFQNANPRRYDEEAFAAMTSTVQAFVKDFKNQESAWWGPRVQVERSVTP
jgi:hypothetical protein